MIRTFRPWQIFERLGEDNKLNLAIPTVPGTTSRTVFMLETALLIAAARIVKAKSILEIGTCMGYTAMHLAMNTGARITAVDVERKPQVWEGTEWEKRITYLPDGGHRCHQRMVTQDMVFVDANHDYECVKRDTKIAMECNPQLIAWHDYSNPCEPGVMKALAELAVTHSLIHVQDSWICFWFKNGFPGEPSQPRSYSDDLNP